MSFKKLFDIINDTLYYSQILRIIIFINYITKLNVYKSLILINVIVPSIFEKYHCSWNYNDNTKFYFIDCFLQKRKEVIEIKCLEI